MISKILIANRGEVAIRIARAAAEMGLPTVAVFSADDASSLHVRAADQAVALAGTGAAAYLDLEQMIAVAKNTGCDAIHPGYGFLSENVTLAERCREEQLTFIGTTPELLALFSDKPRARSFAQRCNVPVLPATIAATSLEEARAFLEALGPSAGIMVKAISGGGGRGMRPVHNSDDLDEAFARCQSEARKAFGSGEVYVEQLIKNPRHIEVQVIGDGSAAIHLGERDCTMQRRHQKLVEITPCPTLAPCLRDKITAAALRLATNSQYTGLGTFEFLIDGDAVDESNFIFMEANPRLQVEHTITEAVTGIDLVRTQIELASGRTLVDLGLEQNAPLPQSYAMQLRINMETIDFTGSAHPMVGTINVYEIPSGPGIRVDGYGYGGYTANPAFDPLLAKLVVTSRSLRFKDLVDKARRALKEFRITGVNTNIPFLLNLLDRPEISENLYSTHFIEEHAAELAACPEPSPNSPEGNVPGDGLSPNGLVVVTAPRLGRIVEINIRSGDSLEAGQTVAVIEAMKMEFEIKAGQSGVVQEICVVIDDNVSVGDPLLYLTAAEFAHASAEDEEEIDLDFIRPDLAELNRRLAYSLDESRPQAVAKRSRTSQRTARANVEDLCDPGSFMEYGALAVAAQRQRRSPEELMQNTPADGLVAGIGSVNKYLVGEDKSRCLVLAYDYSVLAGTQGFFNHKKLDRMLKIAHEQQLPVVLFAEGGGGRPGDTDATGVMIAGLDLPSFANFAGLNGKVPLVGIVSGPCFAGNAALLGCCDVIIATANANIGMGGPVMIEGGGLGVFGTEEVGPISAQTRNGVVDIAVADELEGVAVAKQYLSYFQGNLSAWDASDQRLLRRLVPENRRRIYDVRTVIQTMADTGSVLELRPSFGPGMVTALIRIEGMPFGLIANDSRHSSGAIEAEDADKAARFMQLCNAHHLPIISLCDTPGFMVGPEVEERAQVRHVCRMFVTGSHLSVPYFTVVLRKGYGLGAMAMAKGGFHESSFTAAWPSGEFGAMGLEGAVKMGFKRELEAAASPAERDKLYDTLLAQLYERGQAVNIASYLEIDTVIDPADTRRWIMLGLQSVLSQPQPFKPFIDTW